jgi:hypothetical protein
MGEGARVRRVGPALKHGIPLTAVVLAITFVVEQLSDRGTAE